MRPWAYQDEVKAQLDLDLLSMNEINISEYSAVLLAVSHDQFFDLDGEPKDRVLYDVKSKLKIYDKAL